MSEFERVLLEMDPEAIRAEIAELRARQGQLSEQISMRNEVLAMRRRIEPIPATKASDSEAMAAAPPMTSGAIREIMQTDAARSWKLEEIQEEIVGRGWATRTPALRNRVQAAARRMALRGELERPDTGYYRLPTDKPTADVSAPAQPDPLGRPWGGVPTGLTRFNRAGES